MPSARLPPPLAHLRVVDLTDLRGALAGRILADLGADVIKVEPPGGDPDRLRPPFAGDVAAPDRSLAVPLPQRRQARRRARPRRRGGLAAASSRSATRADVLIENLDAGDARRAPRAGGDPRPPSAPRPRGDRRLRARRARARAGVSSRCRPSRRRARSAPRGSRTGRRAGCRATWRTTARRSSRVTGALAALLDRARARPRADASRCRCRRRRSPRSTRGRSRSPTTRASTRCCPPAYPRDADGPALVRADGRRLGAPPRRDAAAVARARRAARRTASRRRSRRPRTPGTALVGARRRGGWSAPASTRSPQQGRRAAGAAVAALARLPLRRRSSCRPSTPRSARSACLAGEALAARPRAEVLAHGLRLGLPIAPVNTPEEFVAAEQTRVRGYFRPTGFPHLGDAPVAPFPVQPRRDARRAPPSGARRPARTTAAFAPRVARARRRAAPSGPGPRRRARRQPRRRRGRARALRRARASSAPRSSRSSRARAPTSSAGSPSSPTRPNRSFMFNDENRGQQSVCLDLRTPRRPRRSRSASARRPTSWPRTARAVSSRAWGLDYDDVRARAPRRDLRLVAGLRARRPARRRRRPSARSPRRSPAPRGSGTIPTRRIPRGSSLEHPDHIAGKLAAVAVLAALEHRRRTGEGQHIELAQTEAAAYLLGELYLEGPLHRPPAPRRRATPSTTPVRTASIRRRATTAGARSRSSATTPGSASAARSAGRATPRSRRSPAGSRCARRSTRASRRGRATRAPRTAAAHLQAAGVSAMPVQGPTEHRADPHLAARGALVTLDDPEIGPTRHVANPLRLGRTPLVPPRPAPRLGADTAAGARAAPRPHA